MNGLAKVFEIEPAGVNWPRAVAFLDAGLVPLFVFWAIGHEQYILSALFGLLFSALCDPGGRYRQRASRISIFALIGAGVTALGFEIGADAWGRLVLASFAVTLVAGLAITLGLRRFVDALLLNIWFIVAIALASNLQQHARITSYIWAQVLAWTGGAALWIAVTFAWWLIRGRADSHRPFAEIPGDISRKKLTRPLIVFAVIRALVISGTVALAFGLDLSYGYWIPIAAMIAMKPSLEQAMLVAAQRLVGAAIGAAAATLLLLIPANEHGLKLFTVRHGLEIVALVLFMHGAGIRFWNYTLYTAAIAAGVLILVDLPQPSHYSAEGYRVLWTLCGVGIGLFVMLSAALLTRLTAKAPPQPT
ncbi:FUSC family protein [Actinomadura bangladeshensis]|uniref:FUSC family protein n=1 Tax=Actinomadura bangladeshensis TaxID=453573 RepID=A0A4R4NX02_9ACTN|nr:FUSC family protein [Actinomadura bangladeshensis]TDC12703.1 FUSC family protein [Actinomadura bangladeshensis]